MDSVDTITDTDTGDTIYGAVTLHTAPEAATADSVHVTVVEQIEPFIAQSVEPSIDQDTTETARIYSGSTMTAYGAQTTTIKCEIIVAENTMEMIRKLSFRPMVSGDDGFSDIAAGYTGYMLKSQPDNIYAYTPIVLNDAIIGRYYFDGVKLPPQLPAISAGEQAKLTLELSVGGDVVYLEKN